MLDSGRSELEFSVRNAFAVAADARAYRVTCAHGVSSALLVPGQRPLADLVVLDLLSAGHHRRHGCACAPAMPLCPTAQA